VDDHHRDVEDGGTALPESPGATMFPPGHTSHPYSISRADDVVRPQCGAEWNDGVFGGLDLSKKLDTEAGAPYLSMGRGV